MNSEVPFNHFPFTGISQHQSVVVGFSGIGEENKKPCNGPGVPILCEASLNNIQNNIQMGANCSL